jgi:serine/threonine protein kinase
MKKFKLSSNIEFEQEINALLKLNEKQDNCDNIIVNNTDIGNKNVVEFIEYFSYKDNDQEIQKIIILEYCEKGDLQKLIKRTKNQQRDGIKNYLEYLKKKKIEKEKKEDEKKEEKKEEKKDMDKKEGDKKDGDKKKKKEKFDFFSQVNLLKFLKQILNGLKFIHSKRLIHRDLKPANILLTQNYEGSKKNFFLI